jgi:hypothetical protein
MTQELPSTGESPRPNEDLEHRALKAVLSEEEQILRDIAQLIGQKSAKAEALTVIERQYLPKLEEAGKRFELALKAWQEKIGRELADLEREAEQ